MFNAEILRRNYSKQDLKSDVLSDVGTEQHPVVAIETPFRTETADFITVYVYPNPHKQVRVTDNGWTLDDLESAGVAISELDASQVAHFQTILNQFGIKQNAGSKKLSISVPESDIEMAKQKLVRGLLAIQRQFGNRSKPLN
ncbi:DUF1828 domain-containing protein [Schleiferilactobacillus harbinensis]|jgi:hypothetical protein|uniref:DUF1828 domain-containing protein n=1 Tax=Schleiferilactobacillus harbinensis TaxID=304207 RepID=UPI001AAE6B1A|nr:DUF1828 domain-containing protein [Schleiferilactobacillus harbinensis]MBO3092962.1 DUF1828 domain-containing protein [Schleiferilactobacillus harbinensis]